MSKMIMEDIKKKQTWQVNETNGMVWKRFAMLDTSNQGCVKYPTSDGVGNIKGVTLTGNPNGINDATVLDGKNISLGESGDAIVTASGTIGIGDLIMAEALTGKAKTIPVGSTPTGDYEKCGEALTAAADGEDVLVSLQIPTSTVTV